MKKSELKEIIKECIEEIFEENNFFMNLVSESLKVAISTTIRESINALPSRESNKNNGDLKYINKSGKFDPRAFLTSQFAQENLSNTLTEIVQEDKSSPNEHSKYVKEINNKIPDQKIFGDDLEEFFSKTKKLYKGGKK